MVTFTEVARTRILMFLACLVLGGCTLISLEPARPDLAGDTGTGDTSAELIIVIEQGIYESDGRSSGKTEDFAAYVDDSARAWMPENGSYTRIPVTAGRHAVRVEKPYRVLFFFFGLPLPDWGSVKSEVSVTCSERQPCGVAVQPNVQKKGGLVLRARPLSADELPGILDGLRFIEAK